MHYTEAKIPKGCTLTTMEMATHLRICVDALNRYRQYQDFPRDAVVRTSTHNLWNPKPVEKWFLDRAKKTRRGVVPKFVQAMRDEGRVV